MAHYNRQLRILIARSSRPEYGGTIEGFLYKMETFPIITNIRIF